MAIRKEKWVQIRNDNSPLNGMCVKVNPGLHHEEGGRKSLDCKRWPFGQTCVRNRKKCIGFCVQLSRKQNFLCLKFCLQLNKKKKKKRKYVVLSAAFLQIYLNTAYEQKRPSNCRCRDNEQMIQEIFLECNNF